MGSYIVERVLGTETDRRLGLAGAQVCRPVSFLSDTWTRIRIGARLAVNASSGAMNPAEFFIGLTNSTTHAWASDYCSHAVGAWYSGAAFTSTTNGCGMSYGYFTKRIVHTTTILNSNALIYTSAASVIVLTNTTVRNCGMMLEIVKKAGSVWAITLSGGRLGSTASYADQTSDGWFDTMSSASMADVDARTGIVGSTLEREAAAGAIDEGTYGALTSVCVYWKNTASPLEICDLSVSRIE